MASSQQAHLSRRDYETAAELRLALRTFLSRSEQIARAHALTPQRYQLLLLIKASPGQTATVGELSKTLAIGQSAVTQLVRRAETLGLVRRHPSTKDARVRHLRLTREGERRLAGAVAELGQERTALLETLGQLEPSGARPLPRSGFRAGRR